MPEAPQNDPTPAADPSTAPEDAPETTSPASDAPADADPQGDPAALGDAGKKALDAMKAERNAARQEAAEAKAEAARLKAAQEGREAEHKAELEAQKVREEALATANQRILKAEIRAQAAGKLADPADALNYLDLADFEVGEDGDVDSAAITQAIAELLDKKPYLAAQGQRFQGSGDQGPRNEPRPTQLSRDDVDRLAREGKHAEIAQAQADGRLADLLSGKQS